MFDSGRSYFLGRSHIRLTPMIVSLIRTVYFLKLKADNTAVINLAGHGCHITFFGYNVDA